MCCLCNRVVEKEVDGLPIFAWISSVFVIDLFQCEWFVMAVFLWQLVDLSAFCEVCLLLWLELFHSFLQVEEEEDVRHVTGQEEPPAAQVRYLFWCLPVVFLFMPLVVKYQRFLLFAPFEYNRIALPVIPTSWSTLLLWWMKWRWGACSGKLVLEISTKLKSALGFHVLWSTKIQHYSIWFLSWYLFSFVMVECIHSK